MKCLFSLMFTWGIGGELTKWFSLIVLVKIYLREETNRVAKGGLFE